MWRTVVRRDPEKNLAYSRSRFWNGANLEIDVFKLKPDSTGLRKAIPFSGNERNRLFLQTEDGFKDVSLVSGVDFQQDGRGFVSFDINRDGYLDLGVTSPNSPRFQIALNTLGRGEPAMKNHGSAFIKLRGGNEQPTTSRRWSPRDGFGSQVRVLIASTWRAIQHNSSDGLSSQNGNWLHVGLGDCDKIDAVEVRWSSGKVTRHENIFKGTRAVLREDGGTTLSKD